MSRGRVLVVDDDDDLREALDVILSGEGFAVTEAENGERALDALERERFDVVLLDLFMPVMDGWRTLEEIARRGTLDTVPIYICTSAPERAPAGHPVLKKPFDLSALLDAIGAALQRRHAQ